jgi:hypothetical protein
VESNAEIVRSVRETLASYDDPTVMFALQKELAIKEERFEDARWGEGGSRRGRAAAARWQPCDVCVAGGALGWARRGAWGLAAGRGVGAGVPRSLHPAPPPPPTRPRPAPPRPAPPRPAPRF